MDPTAGYPLMLWLQGFHGPALDALFVLVTRLGDEAFYWLALPLLYWLWDRRAGMRLVIVFLLSAFLNDVVKLALELPRPSAEVVRVLYADSGTGPGFPSGHAQGVTVLWGALALEVRRRWLTVLALLLIALVSTSRMYLGLHFPLDVAGGLALGGLVLLAYRLVHGTLTGRRVRLALAWEAVLVTVLPLLLLALALLAVEPGQLTLAGKTLGFAIGGALAWLGARQTGLLSASSGMDAWWRALLASAGRLALGYALLLGVAEGLDLLLPEALPAQMLRYALVGVTAIWLAPWLFRRLRLERAPVGASSSPVA